MSLTLYYHPLSSYCHKVLIALYENDTPFQKHLVDLGNEAERAKFAAIWPIGKFPVLHDAGNRQVLPESSIIIEYLAQRYPGKTAFFPAEAERALQVRLQDRFYDTYIHTPMQKVIADRLRPPAQKDPLGVEQATAQMHTALTIAERELAGKTWVLGSEFTLADCAAGPALFYADKVLAFAGLYPITMAYLRRLMARPSYARVLQEAEPYFAMIPQ
jgi:glutathione S-transferase